MPPIREVDQQQRAHLRRRALGGYRYVRLRWRVLFALVDGIGSVFSAAARLLAGLRNGLPPDDPRRILVVQFDHLGDAILTTSIFAPLRKRFPQARIDVLAASWNRAVFDSAAEVDRVIVCARNRFTPGAGLSWIPATIVWGLRLRQHRYDLGIDVRGEFPHNVLLWLSGAARRLGWASGGGGFLLTDNPDYVSDRPELQSRAALLKCLGIDCDDGLRATFRPSAAACERAKAAWSEMGVAGQDTRIVLHVGAGTAAKRWPVEYWRRLVDRLGAEGNVAVALVGTSSDGQTARTILGNAKPPHAVDWTGRFRVDELAAVLQQADVLVGADSGPAHLAAAVQTPAIVLFSGTNSMQQWQPRGKVVHTLRYEVACSPCHRKTCPIAGHPCMRGLRPGHVLDTLKELLGARPPVDSSGNPTVQMLPSATGSNL